MESAKWLLLPVHPDRIGIWKMLVFVEGAKPEYPGKDENQQQTQPTYDARTGNQTQATLVGGAALTTTPPLLPQMLKNQN